MPRQKHQPERRCAGCGRRFPKTGLFRLVRTPEGSVQPDPSGRAHGRGAYICTYGSCWQVGLERGGLERSLRSPVSPADKKSLAEYFSTAVGQAAATQHLGPPEVN